MIPCRHLSPLSRQCIAFEGDDHLGGSAIHAVAGHCDVVARAQDVVHLSDHGAVRTLEDLGLKRGKYPLVN